MGGKNVSSKAAPVVETPAKPAPVVETQVPASPPATDDESKAAAIRRVSAEMGNETEPKKIVARLKEQGVPWCQTTEQCDYIVRYTWNLFNRGKGKKSADMDLDTILARLEQVRGFVQSVGNKG
jgi:hypothetical protein